MARTSNRRQREAARQRAQQAAAARQAAGRRRRRLVAGIVGAVVVLGIVAAALGARGGTSRPSTAPTSTTVPSRPSTTADLPATGVEPVPAPMGATLTGATPCPAEDGSSPRTTLFTEPPPTCIDPGSFYVATITTSVGEMTVQLNPQLAPRTVNDVVVLARYHFYDGQPVTAVTSRQSFTVGLAFSGEGADRAPGFPFPGDPGGQGTVLTPGTLATGGPAGTAGARGQLLVATFEAAAGIDPGVTAFGFMLSGDDVLRTIDSLASQDGLPTQAVTITSISVARSSPIPS